MGPKAIDTDRVQKLDAEVNNSIILVATIERRMQEIDGPPEEAIIQGTVDRLRPVLLTALFFTTVGGNFFVLK